MPIRPLHADYNHLVWKNEDQHIVNCFSAETNISVSQSNKIILWQRKSAKNITISFSSYA